MTVVLPTRDRPELVREAVHAIQAQDYEGVITTLVVHDGVEPDVTLERSSATRPVRVLENTRTPGLAGSRNTGILSGDDPLIAFCDDDDAWLPDKLRAQVLILAARQDAEVCSTGILVDFEGRLTPRVAGASTVTHEQLLRSRMSMLHSSTLLFRRDALIDAIGMVDEDIPGSHNEDWDLLLRAARRRPVSVVDRPLVRVRWGRTSFYARRWDTKVESLEWMLEHHPELAAHRVGAARVHGQIAFAHACAGRSRSALGWAARALRRDPLQWRAVAAALATTPVVNGERLLELLHRFGRGV